MNKNLPLALLTAAVLSACAAGPDYKRPELALPEKWPAQPAGQAAAKDESWWHVYHDAALDKLEDEALANNADLRLAIARIAEAHAQLGLADANLYPSLSANVTGSRTQSSAAGTLPLTGIPRTQNDTRVTLDASYELDLWGRLRRADEAAQAQLLAVESARDTVRLSLTAQVAQQYFALLSYDREEALLRRALQGRQEALALQHKRASVGVISDLDTHAAEAEEATFRAQLAATTQAREQQEAALALLLGRSPRDVMEAKLERGAPATPDVAGIPEGLSTDVLLQRPDVREAEQQLIAFNANIGAVRAEMFPSVTLTAYLGSESTVFSNLFSGPAGIFQFAAGLSQPLFNAGSLKSAVQVAEAQRDEALVGYRQAVAAAFADVRSALSEQEGTRRTLDAAIARSKAMARAHEQVQARYRAGVSSQLDLLDAERDALQAEVNRLDAERAQRSAVADFYKAIGGGA